MLIRGILLTSLCITGALLAMDGQQGAPSTLADLSQTSDVLLNRAVSIEDEAAELSTMLELINRLLIEKKNALEIATKAHNEGPTRATGILVMTLQDDLDAIRASLLEIVRQNDALLD